MQTTIYRTILLSLLSRKISTICSSSLSVKLVGPPIQTIQIRINLSTLASFNGVRNGDTSKFIAEKSRSTSDVVGGINKANLNDFIVLGYLDKHPFKRIAEYASPGVGWFFTKNSSMFACFNFCVVSNVLASVLFGLCLGNVLASGGIL